MYQYVNGNYKVTLLDDGTKIRYCKDSKPIADFPENIDVKLTNKCDLGCKFCHENSTINGKTGNLYHPFFDSLHAGTEIACGGGNLFEIDGFELTHFFERLRKNDIYPSITINQSHLDPNKYKNNLDLLKLWINKQIIFGIGISYNGNINSLKQIFEYIPELKEKAVIHTINGINDFEDYKRISNICSKILILGYKTFRRGLNYKEIFKKDIIEKQKSNFNNIHNILNIFETVSFDNLAIEQLDIKRILLRDTWEKFYMGDEGYFTMYIDLVEEKFAKNSYASERFKLENYIDNMFARIKEI